MRSRSVQPERHRATEPHLGAPPCSKSNTHLHFRTPALSHPAHNQHGNFGLTVAYKIRVTGLRYALRSLRLNLGFALVAIVTLGLGIGATTAMFTVVDGVVLKSLRYPDADRIVAVNTKFTDTGRSIWRTANGDVQDLR